MSAVDGDIRRWEMMSSSGRRRRWRGPITIGDRAQVGAHALVMRDLPADQLAVGHHV